MAESKRDKNDIPSLLGVSNADSKTTVAIGADPTTKRLFVDSSETAQSTLVAFITDIPTAATRVQLASNTIIAGIIQAPSTNTGNIFIGGSDVSSSVFGAELQPGQSAGIAISNTDKIFVDTATNGNDVSFLGS